nr:serine/threonine-protein kinase [Bifidobacterium pongonis]
MIKNTSPPLACRPPSIDGLTFVRHVGSGSTANVHLYRESDPDRLLAVKVGDDARAHAPACILREADMMARLPEHPNILPLLALGTASDGSDYLVFEYASGGNYRELLRKRALSYGEALDLGIKLAGALCAAHRAGVLHRDIKPSNVLIRADGEPALADFGIACSVYGDGRVGYSIPWAAPETLSGGRGRECADLYSLASLLYAALAGSSPFEHGYHPQSHAELRHAMLHLPLPPIGRDDVPEDFERLLGRAMARDPDKRFPSVADFAESIRMLRDDAQAASVSVDSPSTGDSASAPAPMTASAPVRMARVRFPRRCATAIPIVAAVLLAILPVLMFAVQHADAWVPSERIRVPDGGSAFDFNVSGDSHVPGTGSRSGAEAGSARRS